MVLQAEPRAAMGLRRYIVGSVLALYLLLGIPLWFKLTEIYRAHLPANFIHFLQSHPNADVQIHNTVYVSSIDNLYFPDLSEAVQVQVDHELHRMNQDPAERLVVDWNVTLINDKPPSEDDHVLILQVGDGEGISINEHKRETTLFYTLESVKNNDLPFFITQSLLYHIFDQELKSFQVKNQNIKSINSIQYSPKVHLSFKLLTGDGFPVDWDIENALEEYFQPTRQFLQNYINFTIDSEVKYFTRLNLPKDDIIQTSDLSTLFDFSDWDVSSNQYSYPTLNFILYFPSKDQAPLTFAQEGSSFLIPQWGSILLKPTPIDEGTYISKDSLFSVFQVFTSELFFLLGLPSHPKTPQIRLDTLLKTTILTNLNNGLDSLTSLLKLSNSLPNISIPKSVQNNVKNSLNARMSTIEQLQEKDFNSALLESNKVAKFAEEAFFDREIVQQAFFPQEHKIAVYLPLLGPLTVMLIFGSIRIISEIKPYRRKEAANAN